MSVLRFGEYLAQLLHEQECSGSRLAGMIGVDPALVYRWLRNEATPKLDTAYCADIMRHLSLSQIEQNRLKEAQIYSLSRPLERRPRMRNGSAAVERLLRHAGPRQHSNGSGPLSPPLPDLPVLRQSGVIWGRPAILEATISLLEQLPALPRLQTNTLMLSFQGAEDAFEDFPEFQARYEKAIQSVLQRGWQICHLWRLDQDARRSILLVENMLKLLGTGRYLPHYVSQQGTLAPPYDLLIVPKTAAMLFFATQNPRRADAALLTHDLEQIELLRTHFYQLCALSQPLAQTYLPEEDAKSWQAYADAESLPGGRLVVKNGLTFITEPPAWYREGSYMVPSIDLAGSALAPALKSLHQRYKAFQANIGLHLYRDICPRRAIERLVNEGEPPHKERVQGFRFSNQERRKQLEYAIHVLSTYEHYQLALIDEEEEQLIPTEMFWEIAGEHTVLMLTWSTDTTGKDIIIDLVIHEPMIIHAFQDYFAELWEQIAPQHKEKRAVITWLEQQLALLD